mgnify:CR=1 FL=1
MISVFVAPTLITQLGVNRYGLLETGLRAPLLFAENPWGTSQLGRWSGYMMHTDFGSRLLLVHDASGVPLVMPVSHRFRHLDWVFHACMLAMIDSVSLDARRRAWVRGQLHSLSFQRGRTALPLSRQREISKVLGFVLRDARRYVEEGQEPDPSALSLELMRRLNKEANRREDDWLHDFLLSLGISVSSMLAQAPVYAVANRC